MFQLSNSEPSLQLYRCRPEAAGGQAEGFDIYAIVGLTVPIVFKTVDLFDRYHVIYSYLSY